MTLSKRHINHVLNVKGYAFVDPNEAPNLRKRYAESYIRRRSFALEDATIIAIYGLYKDAFYEIQSMAHRQADELGIRQLENIPVGVEWRRRVNRYADTRLRRLGDDVAALAYEKVTLGYLANYYGKLWMLDSMTVDDVINIRRISPDDASLAVMNKQLLEDVGNKIIYDNLGVEWREQFANEMDDVLLKIRRRLTTGMGNGETIKQLMNGVADTLGVTIDRRRTGIPNVRANFNRVQSITRSYFIDANNRAALAAYQANADVVGGVEWLTANDGRVCPTCQRLAGMVWAVDDIHMKHPVTDTHPLCRCSLIPVLLDQMPTGDAILVFADDEPPSLGFRGWLMGLGLGFMLADFIGMELDSSRI
jgi:SPP1 gp7 family putative phage head morphogenesis protein